MSAASVTIPLNRWPLWLKPSRRLMYTAGIGFGIFLLGYLFTSSRKKRRSERAVRERRETPIDLPPFYQRGLEVAVNGRVDFRKSRAEICGCEDDIEFAAKLWCLRQAFHNIPADWLDGMTTVGRRIVCDILRHDKRETQEFLRKFDALIEFLKEESNREMMFEELSHRHVKELGVWDVLFDIILLDAFDHISSLPSAVVTILSNRFITRKVKEASLSTVLWTIITAKRRRLRFSDGFMSQFYSITETVAPALTLAFFGGSTSSFRELCQYFRQEVFHFVSEIFSFSVRYTSLDELKPRTSALDFGLFCHTWRKN